MKRCARAMAFLAVVSNLLGGAAAAESGGRTGQTLGFTGTLRTAVGPLQGTHQLGFILHRGSTACTTPAQSVTPNPVDGSFTAPLVMDGCAADFFDGQDVTLDVLVDGSIAVTGQPVHPVPYAKYADVASLASGGTQSNIARRSTADLVFYVRPDGHDACDGSTDAPATPSRTGCALATPAAALARLPEVVRHAVTINVAPGTYRVTAAGQTFWEWKYAGSVTVQRTPGSSAAVVFSGALAGSPNNVSGLVGVAVQSPGELTLRNLSVEHFGTGVQATRGGRVSLEAVELRNNAGNGLDCSLYGDCTVTGTLSTHDNGANGAQAVSMGRLRVDAGAVLSTARNTGMGVSVSRSALLDAWGAITSDNDGTVGVYCVEMSLCALRGATTVYSPGSYGLDVDSGSTLLLTGSADIQEVSAAVRVVHGAVFLGSWDSGEQVKLRNGSTHGIALDCADRALCTFSGSPNVDIRGFTDLVNVRYGSVMEEAITAGGTFNGSVRAASNSTYAHSRFPNAVQCQDSVCP